MTDLLGPVQHAREIMVVQRKELAELFGFETRNKYALEVEGAQVGFAAEQDAGGLAFLARLFLGHWRTFEIHLFDNARQLMLRVVHPFRFYFQRLEVSSRDGRAIGVIQRRFAILSKRFDVLDVEGRLLLSVSSPIYRPWSFAFERQGAVLARVEKKWSGFLGEVFTDADRFRVAFDSPELSGDERSLVLAAAIFIDLQFFEHKAS